MASDKTTARAPWVHPVKSLREDIQREIEYGCENGCYSGALTDKVLEVLAWWGVELP
jgi:hypothetical protein